MSTAVSPAAHRQGAVFGAFVYLQATSLYNNLRQRLLRLRQPKYLVGAVVGAAYLYFFLFHRMLRVGNAASPTGRRARSRCSTNWRWPTSASCCRASSRAA